MMDMVLNPLHRQVDAYLYETPYIHFRDLFAPMDSAFWMHIALVREGLHARLYLNGELRFETSRCQGIDLSNESPLQFSNSPCIQDREARRFKGVLDELRIYSRALTDEEIRALYLRHPIENAVMDCVT